MWEISVGGQALACIYSLVLGGALCLFYDVIRATRRAGANSAFAVFAGDILFWLISAICVFFFMVALTNGEIRGYIVFSAAAGFIIFRLTLGRLTFYILDILFCFSAKVIARVCEIIADVCAFLKNIAARFLARILKAVSAVAVRLKKLLKSIYKLLYTTKYKRKTEQKENEQER